MAQDVPPYEAELDPGQAVDQVTDRHLKHPALTVVERILTSVGAVILIAFTLAVLLDVVTRTLGAPVNWLQAFILGSFVWGVFLGGAVAHRRREHFRLAAIAEHYTGRRRQLFETLEHVVVLGVAGWMVYFGYRNVLSGMGVILPPTTVPLAVVTASIPVCGALVVVFSIERLVYVWMRGFPATQPAEEPAADGAAPSGEVGRGE
jgi:TRAP-type transport system small permease protein